MNRAALFSVLLAAACTSEDGPPPAPLFFEREVLPILTQSCSSGVSGCHRADPEDPFAFAAGNLDVTSYENIQKRQDVLRSHGAYPVPFLLAKAAGENSNLRVAYRGQQLPLRVPHNGAVLQGGSASFLTLQSWLSNGATLDGVRPLPAPVLGVGPCSTAVPGDFDEASVTSTSQWASAGAELDAAQTVLNEKTCNAGNCHGTTLSDFYLTCGTDERQRAWNFRQLWAFSGSPVDTSDLLQLPAAGGGPHTGGAHFTPDDPAFRTLAAFATKVGVLAPDTSTPGRAFFVERVLPALLSRGCASQGCHSPQAMNDFKLRGGSRAFFSAVQIEKNYHLMREDFTAFEVPDVRRSRFMAKNILPANGGIAHRGGALLEFGGGAADPGACGTWTEASSMFCTMVEWARLERATLGDPNGGNQLTVVYVERDGIPPGVLDFATFAGGADLRAADATVGASGAITGQLGNTRSLLGSCGGGAGGDVRGPDVHHDGETIVFAMRPSAGETLQLWTVKTSGADCRPLLAEAGVHNFDPAWSPDGQWIVYASSKAGGTSKRLGLPQSDLWRIRADGSGAERMTFLSNSEVGPQMMREGRVIMTTEKVDGRDPQGGFYQLAGRRINWDLTDYHPLLGQRDRSPVDPASGESQLPSLGFAQATEIREGLDGNFVFIGSAAGAAGSLGAITIFNRSVGTFENGRTDRGFLPSVLVFPGSYRSPFALPDGRIMASVESGGQLDLVALDPRDGSRANLLTGGRSAVEAVIALRQEARTPYLNHRQLVFGVGPGGDVDAGHAVVHFPDAPMLATLLGANLRRGRNPAAFRAATEVIFQNADGATIGSAPLAEDGSARVRVPAGVPLYLGLAAGGAPLFLMNEEHQYGPGERVSMGVKEEIFDNACGGCHGSVSGRELDIGVRPDVLTGASQSLSASAEPTAVGP